MATPTHQHNATQTSEQGAIGRQGDKKKRRMKDPNAIVVHH